ncbi:DUF3800 domain-containing protein [Enterovirga rhinocerotis]|uniref:Uncharacterized protein DUF3800 n=1 Tax=Enterovirga rhinocerotis TaxID=1339210 RepID=A0A4V3DX41_9HYPH|nr:DUF3800 domain-containing protein [Enterovirga rhinocerotis]TDR87209.1 uncharacterized protein DUF3800 [Enterovirga rhinocerotis]
MSDSKLEQPYRYVAYIDESGDDGLRKIWPLDSEGASEWLVLSAVVVRAERERDVLAWVKEIKEEIRHRQTPDLHFSRLSDDSKRLAVCQQIAKRDVRCFAVVSNKKNMRGYANPRAAKVPARNWFYCWMCRLLLERVTSFCGHRNKIEKTPLSKLKFEFSERGGMSYSQFRAYLEWIKLQSKSDNLYLSRGDLDWSVVDTTLVESYNHRLRAGLQLADAVASAFYQAIDVRSNGTCKPEFAKALRPRMWQGDDGQIAERGLKAMPSPLWRARLLPQQKDIFSFYGYAPEQIGR